MKLYHRFERVAEPPASETYSGAINITNVASQPRGKMKRRSLEVGSIIDTNIQRSTLPAELQRGYHDTHGGSCEEMAFTIARTTKVQAGDHTHSFMVTFNFGTTEYEAFMRVNFTTGKGRVVVIRPQKLC